MVFIIIIIFIIITMMGTAQEANIQKQA